MNSNDQDQKSSSTNLNFDIELPDFITNLKSEPDISHYFEFKSNPKEMAKEKSDDFAEISQNMISSDSSHDNQALESFTKNRLSLLTNSTQNFIQRKQSSQTENNSSESLGQLHQSSTNTDDRAEKNKIYSQRYRQKKNKLFKELQKQNNFLKHKISDLTFRLNEAQLQLNRIKNSNPSNANSSFQKLKQNCIRKVKETFDKNQRISEQEILTLDQQMSQIRGFHKDRVDLLNYHMNQLLDNFLPDSSFYWIDCLVEDKGIWVQNPSQLRKMDREILQLLEIPPQAHDIRKGTKQLMSPFLIKQLLKFHQMWKNLYETYLKVLNQGLFVETINKGCEGKWKDKKESGSVLKIELYFEQIKYRKDLRELKQKWYDECSLQKTNNIERMLTAAHLNHANSLEPSCKKRTKVDLQNFPQ